MRVFLLALVCCAFAEDFEESFTIFIDLNDFHVTQADNHEFLSHEAIGEHDNVLLQLTEDQVKHHMKAHDTFDCNPPEEVHEVVSFIQEKMYEIPATPNFVDDAIESNYIQNGAWEKLQQPQPVAFPNVVPYPQSLWGPKTTQAPVLTQNRPISTDLATKEEEEAVARFRDAYKAYKLFNHAVADLPALTATKGATNTLFDSVMDDEDKKLFGMFSNQFAQPQGENPLSKIVEDALAGLAEPQQPQFEIPAPQPEAQEQSHHHHHHHKKHSQEAKVEPQQIPEAQPQQVAAPVVESAPPAAIQPQPQQAASTESLELTELEKTALLKLAKKLAATKESKVAEKPAAVQAPEAKPLQTLEVEPQPAPEAAVAPAAPAAPASVAPASVAPSAADTVSHIEKAPPASAFIPENVYAQEAVPFTESPQQITKHVAKRILIPRMEEPGPVIGGGSRPVHIQLPPMDDSRSVGNSRPSAPSQVQLQVGSSIESAAATEAPKASTLAAANDEALTAPEVVIF